MKANKQKYNLFIYMLRICFTCGSLNKWIPFTGMKIAKNLSMEGGGEEEDSNPLASQKCQ